MPDNLTMLNDRYNTGKLLLAIKPLTGLPITRGILDAFVRLRKIEMKAVDIERTLLKYEYILQIPAPGGCKANTRYYRTTRKYARMVGWMVRYGRVFQVLAYSGPHPGYGESDLRKMRTYNFFSPLPAKQKWDSLEAPNKERKLLLNGFPYNSLALRELCPPDPVAMARDAREIPVQDRDWVTVGEAIHMSWRAGVTRSDGVWAAREIRYLIWGRKIPRTKSHGKHGYCMILKSDLEAFIGQVRAAPGTIYGLVIKERTNT
jgi:hypothetical protein